MTGAPYRFPTYFLSHGGGPWPWIEGPMHDAHAQLEMSLAGLLSRHPVLPRAVLMVTAHWEEADFTVSTAPAPGMIYDYYNFPENTYHVTYKAPGDPVLAERVMALLIDAGIPCAVHPTRGYDHGTFVPMHVLRPAADIPVVQMSIRADYDPARHMAVGRALSVLRDEGVLILGSGLSYHNLRRFGAAGADASARFDAWLQGTLVEGAVSTRGESLVRWAEAPAAREAHPREDHLVPLMVAAGAAEGDAATCVYHEDAFFGALSVSSFAFG